MWLAPRRARSSETSDHDSRIAPSPLCADSRPWRGSGGRVPSPLAAVRPMDWTAFLRMRGRALGIARPAGGRGQCSRKGASGLPGPGWPADSPRQPVIWTSGRTAGDPAWRRSMSSASLRRSWRLTSRAIRGLWRPTRKGLSRGSYLRARNVVVAGLSVRPKNGLGLQATVFQILDYLFASNGHGSVKRTSISCSSRSTISSRRGE